MSFCKLRHPVIHFVFFATVSFATVALSSLTSVRAEDPPSFVPGSWTMVLLPDTQRYTVASTDPGLQTFGTMTQWIADNKGSRNIQFVMHEGDITGGNTAATWQAASNAMAVLDNANIPYSLAPGNHDFDQWDPVFQNSPGRDTLMNNYFPESRYAAMPTYGGVFEAGQTQNNYHLFSAGDKDYITVALEWGPRDETLAWADSLLTQYSDRTAMIVTHAYTYSDGTRYDWTAMRTSQNYNPHCSSYAFSDPHNGTENVNDGQEIWDKLVSKHANASMVLSGHIPWAGARQVAIGDHGNVVHEMVAAYHDPPQGWLRLLEFNPDGETVQVKTYSPKLDQYMTDANNQFVINTESLPDPPESVIPAGSILVATRGNAAGIVALDLDGNKVGGFVPQGAYDVIDVQQVTPGGDILLGQHPAGGGGDLVSRYAVNGTLIGNVSGMITGKYAAHLAMADPVDGANLAFIEHNTGGLSSIDLATNQVVSSWTSATSPRGIDVGPDGFVYMAVQNSGIWKISQDLSSHVLAVPDAQDSYADITFGPDGKLYASTYAHNGVIRYDVSTGTSEDFIASAESPIDLCSGLMFHPTTGNLLASSYRTNQILEFDGESGNFIGVFADVDQAWCMSMAPYVVPGDANSDGLVDAQDAAILAGNWQQTVTGGYSAGDFDQDGDVDDADVTILAANWQQGASADVAVPEPGVLSMLLLAAMSIAALRHRRTTGFVLLVAVSLSSVSLVATAQAQSTKPLPWAPGSWTLVVLPDTQRYTAPTTDPKLEIFKSITHWIANNKQARNIQMVLHEGDITACNSPSSWKVASNAMAVLDKTGVPYSLATGNHDYDRWKPPHQHSPSRNTSLNDFFPVSRYQQMATFGGTFEPGKTENNYHLFTAGGKDYIVVALEWGPRDEAVVWADSILKKHSHRTAMIVTHVYTYSDGSRYDWATKKTSQKYNPHCASYAFSAPHNGTENVNDGEQIWQKLVSKNKNVSMVFSGHVAWAAARQTVVGHHGQRVHELLAAYHDPPQGWLRLLEFLPDGQTVQVKTFSPHLDKYMSDDANQFTLRLNGEQAINKPK